MKFSVYNVCLSVFSLSNLKLHKTLAVENIFIQEKSMLRLTFNPRLAFNRLSNNPAHITKTASNCLNKLIQINRIKHLLDKKTMILLMTCLFLVNSCTAQRFGRTLVVPILRNSNWFRISLLVLFWDSESSIIFHKALDLLIGCLSAIDSI